jgi:hypothetical protein
MCISLDVTKSIIKEKKNPALVDIVIEELDERLKKHTTSSHSYFFII